MNQSEVPPSLRRFFSIQELINELVECLAAQTKPPKFQIRSENARPVRDLYNLCLTSRHFNAAFTPILYRELDVKSHSFRMQSLKTSPHLYHTRIFTGRFETWLDSAPSRPLYYHDMQTLLTGLTNVRALRVINRVKSTTDPRIVDTQMTFTTLPPQLQYLELKYICPVIEPLALTSPTNKFTNLATLVADAPSSTLEFSRWREGIVDILLRSPNLTTLNLNLSPSVHDETIPMDQRPRFLDICSEYAARGQNGPTLRLRTLRVRWGNWDNWDNWDNPDHSRDSAELNLWEGWVDTVARMVDLKELEVLKLLFPPPDGPVFARNLTMDVVPRLRSFLVSEYTQDIHTWATSIEPEFARQVGFDYLTRFDWEDIPPGVTMVDLFFPGKLCELRRVTLDLDTEQSRGNNPITILEALGTTSGSTLELLELHYPYIDEPFIEALTNLVSKLVNLRELTMVDRVEPEEKIGDKSLVVQLARSQINLRLVTFLFMRFFGHPHGYRISWKESSISGTQDPDLELFSMSDADVHFWGTKYARGYRVPFSTATFR
ncbi:hypothetical protein B0T16DRAFT_450288 [Cercophora newfieldiana]|uniref:Uncharacterized protein n=1 Tax=Cercophora newfieldiana TaxID=92897 RepID=A0AA39XU05_9PEZI|nr:hypothetical protein B0T16DRAFT_450288 [Cercophora newfieldiana]